MNLEGCINVLFSLWISASYRNFDRVWHLYPYAAFATLLQVEFYDIDFFEDTRRRLWIVLKISIRVNRTTDTFSDLSYRICTSYNVSDCNCKKILIEVVL